MDIFLRLLFLLVNSTVLVRYGLTMDYFTAIVDVSKAVEVGRELAADLNTYLLLEETRLNQIRRVAKRLAENRDDVADAGIHTESEEYLGNPVNAYLTVQRLAANWKDELSKLISGSAESPQAESGDFNRSASMMEVLARVEEKANMLPGSSDIDGAADALLRLQATYKLSADELARGNVLNINTNQLLSAAQCMHLGTQAYNNREFARAEEWFRVAYDHLVKELNSQGEREYHDETNLVDEDRPTIEQVLDHLSYALGRQGRYAEALNITKLLLVENPFNRKAEENMQFYQERIGLGEGSIGPAPPPQQLSRFEQETATYQAMCRGEKIFPSPPASSVYCRYYVPHPYYILGPLKEEILFPDPRIVMWYDLIHPEETARIQALATPKLRRATVKNPVTGVLEFADYRTSKSAWLSQNLDEVTNRMFQRIESVSRLSLEASEDLQVANYGIGGFYAPHFDFGRKREKDAFEERNGNRIATIIFYLTDVKAGGSTVFNRIGARVDPVRGAAAFWWNLLPSGEGDLRTRHAACPVLVGSKWVMNMWFHERGQEFRRPCELELGTIEMDDGF